MQVLTLKWSLHVDNVTHCPAETPISNNKLKGMAVKDFV